ncbi:MAG TPA: SRPBCC domain-containing protein [Rhizomicrobium sp.]
MNKGHVVEEAAVRFERVLPASVEKAWSFLTETQRLTEWYGEGVIEPREGGKVELMGGHIRGVVTGWRPGQFLAYTWNVFSPGETVSRWPVSYLEFLLAADGTNTKLILTHRPIPKAVQPQTMMGWHTFLDMLATATRGEPVGPMNATMQKNAALYSVDLDNLKR